MNRIRIISLLCFAFTALLPCRAGTVVERYDEARPVIAAKGSWLLGGSAAYSAHSEENYSVAVIKDVNAVGFRVSAVPEFCYFFGDNIGAGLKVSYGRMMLDAATGSAGFGSVSIGVDDYYLVSQDVKATAFLRYYIPIGDSKRFAMFADAGIRFAWGHAKNYDEHTGSIVGTWQESRKFGLVVNPGLMAYVTDHISLFAGVGIAGVNFGKVTQSHNQVDEGSRKTHALDYMLDLTGLRVGLDFHFGKR